MAYLTVELFRVESLMPGSQVDQLEAAEPGFLAARLQRRSGNIDARLRKRYVAPFEAPVPDKVVEWLVALVNQDCYLKLGVDPLDLQMAEILAAAKLAVEELKEAADSVEGLFDLPLRADTTSTGISKGGPMAYTEASPYVWKDVQGATGRSEDERGSGSGG